MTAPARWLGTLNRYGCSEVMARPYIMVANNHAADADAGRVLWIQTNLVGQGLLTLACVQDLSQARARWGAAADGFFSLFGTKVLLPGIGDIRTLDAVSRLAGEGDVAVRSLNTSAWWAPRPSANMTYSSRLQPRLPVDQAHSLPAGAAIMVRGARPPSVVQLTNWWDYPRFVRPGGPGLPPIGCRRRVSSAVTDPGGCPSRLHRQPGHGRRSPIPTSYR